eukprot:TRINITY_DN7190_c3_g1_i1.p1 TRINITY_DN7190_c3_g1~~TRINITY_DN7190_c3_g1_i1.p1  ORF type:complete len:654 (+),score=159.89 TRINITY_DN7190_c3_g1_i1:57-2018(+)
MAKATLPSGAEFADLQGYDPEALAQMLDPSSDAFKQFAQRFQDPQQGHGHGHSHGGVPCDGDHGHDAHGHGHGGHGHSHGGVPCDGHHGGGEDPSHGHGHGHSHADGSWCNGDHGGGGPRFKSHKRYVAELKKERERLEKDQEAMMLARKVPDTMTGIPNLGNTCFMNSVMQCIVETPGVAEPLYDMGSDPHASPGKLNLALSLFVRRMRQSRGTVLSNKGVEPLFTHFCHLRPEFASHQQQDAQEYLRCLVDGADEEAAKAKEVTGPADGAAPAKGKKKDQKKSLWRKCYGGVFSRQVVCACGNQGHNHEQFLDLSCQLKSALQPDPDAVKARLDALRRASEAESDVQRKRQEKAEAEEKERKEAELLRMIEEEEEAGKSGGKGKKGKKKKGGGDQQQQQQQQKQTAAKGAAKAAAAKEAAAPPAPFSVEPERLPPAEFAAGFTQTSILQYVNAFFADESVDGYRCSSCTEKAKQGDEAPTGGKHSLSLSSSPQVLTLHLKRFSHDATGSRKIDSYVSFPLELALDSFTLPDAPALAKGLKKPQLPLADYAWLNELEDPQQAAELRRILNDVHPSAKRDNTEASLIRYSLFGVVHHIGSLHRGHYVAQIRPYDKKSRKRSSTWYQISDEHVTETTVGDVLMAPAYLLFYERM